MAFESDELNMRRQEREKEREFMRQQQKLLRIAIIITAVTLVCCVAAILIVYGIVNAPQPPETSSTSSSSSSSSSSEVKPAVPDTVIHIVAGGDLNITDQTVASGNTAGGYDYTEVFLDIAPILSSADLSVLNFEGGLAGAPYGSQYKSAPIQMVQALKNAGVDLLQTANSQSVVNGLAGLTSTIQGIRGAGLEPLGTYSGAAEFNESGGYYIRQVQGVKVAFVAFTKGMDGMGLPEGSENCVNLLYKDYSSTYQKVDKEGITAILRAAKSHQPDVIIALLHWGSEFNNKVSSTQETICKLMLDEGVDAIIGTHSHYVQQVVYDEEADTLIAYSLGDFLGDGDKSGTDYSVLLDLEITKSGETGETSITGYDYTPIYIHRQESGALRILRIREHVAAYESNFIGKVSEEVYLAMKNALSKVEDRM